MIAPFLKTLALVAALSLHFVLLVLAAAQGALDVEPLTLAYRAEWWPIWLLLVPAALAAATRVVGRVGPALVWSAVVVLLAGGLLLVTLTAPG